MPNFNDTIWTSERIFMVDFGRGKTGLAHRRFPDVDNSGYTDGAFPAQHGPIVSAMVGQTNVNVRFYRSEISTTAKLFAVSSDTSVVRITTPGASGLLNSVVSQNIVFRAVAAGRAAIEIRYNWKDGPIIGGLYVQVYPRIQLRMQVHLVTVNGLALPQNFLGKICNTRAQREARMTEFVNKANEAWVPHGVVFRIAGFVDTAWGLAQIPSGNQTPTFAELLTAGMSSPNRSAAAVNVFVIPTSGGAFTGVGVSTAMAINMGFVAPAAPPPPPAVQHFGSGLYLDSTPGGATPQTIQHEMGHIMSLAGLPNQGHSTGDLNVAAGTHTRDDLISRRRLMYPIVALFNAAPSNWRNNTGYGNLSAGSFITYRQLPAAQDFTFQESLRARAATTLPQFYSP